MADCNWFSQFSAIRVGSRKKRQTPEFRAQSHIPSPILPRLCKMRQIGPAAPCPRIKEVTFLVCCRTELRPGDSARPCSAVCQFSRGKRATGANPQRLPRKFQDGWLLFIAQQCTKQDLLALIFISWPLCFQDCLLHFIFINFYFSEMSHKDKSPGTVT